VVVDFLMKEQIMMNINRFPQDERDLRTKLVALMEDWKSEVVPSKIVSRGDGRAHSGASYFCPDGFFLFYTHQKYKILFVAREVVSEAEWDCIEVFYRDHGSDSKPFHNRQFELAYGILHDGTVAYSDKPDTEELRKTFAREGDISFRLWSCPNTATMPMTGVNTLTLCS
jgi:hypothetical protein